MRSAPTGDLPDLAEGTGRPEDVRERAEAELCPARELRPVGLGGEERLRRLLQHRRARVVRRDHEDERPRDELLAPAAAAVEREVALDLALEEARPLGSEVDLDEGLELVVSRLD